MSITVTREGNFLKLGIFKGPLFDDELSKVRALPDRKWDGKQWSVPWFYIKDLLKVFRKEELLIDESCRRLFYPDSVDHFKKIEEPLTFSRDLYDFQEEYVRLPRQQSRLLLAADMGLGKTLTSLERAKVLNPHGRILVICPKVCIPNWKRELELAWGIRGANIYQGPKRKLPEASGHVITTYEAVGELPLNLNFDHIIVDEAHLLSNPESKRFIAVAAQCLNHQGSVQCLTGTPIQHRIENLWSIFYLLDPLLLGSKRGFLEDHLKVIRTMKREIILKDSRGRALIENGKPKKKIIEIPIVVVPKDLDGLAEKIAFRMFRITRDNFTKFKEINEFIEVEMTPKQAKSYAQIEEELFATIGETTLKNLDLDPVRLLRLKQAAEGLHNFDYSSNESGKIEYVLEALAMYPERKCILWSSSVATTEKLAEKLGNKAVIFNGSVSDGYKKLAVWAFHGVETETEQEEFDRLASKLKFKLRPGEAQYFIGTIDMRSSLGINLHRDCFWQIFLSFSWMGNANDQAAARLLRIGQKSDFVLTWYLISQGTVEKQALMHVLGLMKTNAEVIDGKDKALIFGRILQHVRQKIS